MKKRTSAMCFLLIVAMVFGLMPIPFDLNSHVLTAEASDYPLSGSCGVNITWTLTEDTDVTWDLNEGTPYKLTIRGTGELETIDGRWKFYNDTITSISIEEGITKLSDWAFQKNYPSLQTVTLPDSLTKIPERAFKGNHLLETVKFGNGLTTIGAEAFAECTSLKNITLPESLTSIETSAFSECSSLESITLPDNLSTLGSSSFSRCSALTNITCGKGLKIISERAFERDTNLVQIQFNNSLEVIGKFAFAYCTSLEKVSLPDSVTTLQTAAFASTGLTSFTVPKNVTSIEERILQDTPELKYINVAAGNTRFMAYNTILYEKGTAGIPYRAIAFTAAYPITTVSIAEGTEIIDPYVFFEAYKITSVDFPNTLKNIKDQAFRYCRNIKELSIPDSVESIGEAVFADCTSLTKVTIGTSLRDFGSAVFARCSALNTINIAEENIYLDAVDNIIYNKEHTHLYFYALTKPDTAYHVPDTIESMSVLSISYIPALKELYMPKLLKDIPKNAIVANTNLDSIYFPENAPNLADSNSISNNASDLIIFRRPSSLGWDNSFWKSYTYADWEPENTAVEEGTFGDISWKYKADEGRISFTGSGKLPHFTDENPAPWSEYINFIQTVGADSISSIGDYSFYHAEKLIRLETSEEIKKIGNYAFSGCSSLCFLDISTIESIGSGAFENNISLTDGIALIKVLSIGPGAFKGCTAITDVTFGIYLTSLEEEVFAGCTLLNSIIIPESITAIKNGAFKDCIKLRTINIPDQVEEIGNQVFSGDFALEKVYFYGKIPEKWENDSFTECNSNLTIYYRKSHTAWEQWGGTWNGIPVQGLDRFYTEKRDHYSFANTSESFGYEPDYRIPRQRYVDVMRNITTGSYYYAINKNWFGSCYGMTGTTLEFYENPDFKVTDYDVSAQNLYDIAAPKNNNASLTKLIEAYQISQYKAHISGINGCISKNMGDYKGLIQKVEEFERSGGLQIDSQAEPVVLTVYNIFSGHAVIPISVNQDKDGNFVMKVYDPDDPTSLKTLKINNNLNRISYGTYTYASYIPYSSVADAMVGVQLYNEMEDDSLYLSIDKEKGMVTDTQGKGIEQIEGAYEQKPFNNTTEEIFSGIKSFVLPKGNYHLTAKNETDEENTENTKEISGSENIGSTDTENKEEGKKPVTFYLASEENYAKITSSDENVMLNVQGSNTQNDGLEIELQSESKSEESSSFTIMNHQGMERMVEIKGSNATVKVAQDDTIMIQVPAEETVSIDGKELEVIDGQAVSSFEAVDGENPLKAEDLQTNVDCDENNKLNGTISATVISNASSTKKATITAAYYDELSGDKVASYAKEVQLEPGMNMVSLSFKEIETAFSQTDGQASMICNLTVSDENNNTITCSKEGVIVNLTPKTDPTLPPEPIEPGDKEIAVTKVTVSPNELTLTVGESSQLNASVLPVNATDKTLVYEAFNDNVTVTQDGKVTAIKAGSSQIKVSSSNRKYTVINVTVTDKTNPTDPTDPIDPGHEEIAITNIDITPKLGTFGVGESFRLKVSVVPSNASDKTLTFHASNDNITITQEGVVTAQKAGSSQIKVSSSNGKSAVADVIVKNAPNKITLNAKKKDLKVGKTFQIKVKLPNNTASSQISYSSNKKSVAQVSSLGKVTAIKKGTATITVKTFNGITAKLKIMVKENIAVKKVTVAKKKMTLGIGESVPLKASVSPKNATNKVLSYKTSNNKVKITAKGKITAKKVGSSKITIKSSNGKKTTVNVTVKKAPKKITLNAHKKSIKIGKTFQVKVKLPKNTASNKISYSSSKKAVADISASGKITAKKKGKTMITVKTFNGKKAKLKVTVK